MMRMPVATFPVVPQGQAEISQPQGGWNKRPKTLRLLKGRRKSSDRFFDS
jgi:hypothetical protein